MMSKAEADIVKEGYNFCFEEFYTKKETMDYMKEMHNVAEERAGKMFNSRLKLKGLKGLDYLEEAEKRAVERRRRREEDEKRKMINDRLQVLSAKNLELVSELDEKEREMLSLFLTKDFSNETSYTVEGIHEVSSDCHCFTCYYENSVGLSSLPHHDVIERILEEHAAEKDSVA